MPYSQPPKKKPGAQQSRASTLKKAQSLVGGKGGISPKKAHLKSALDWGKKHSGGSGGKGGVVKDLPPVKTDTPPARTGKLVAPWENTDFSGGVAGQTVNLAAADKDGKGKKHKKGKKGNPAKREISKNLAVRGQRQKSGVAPGSHINKSGIVVKNQGGQKKPNTPRSNRKPGPRILKGR